MNKVELRKELLCLMEVASLPTGPAALDAEIESFFVSGAARIDLIGKCMDLDNDMGGYLFDVPLLSDTENAINEVGKSDGEKRRIKRNLAKKKERVQVGAGMMDAIPLPGVSFQLFPPTKKCLNFANHQKFDPGTQK